MMTRTKSNAPLVSLLLVALPLLAAMLLSCNSKSDEEETYQSAASIAITNFYLKANAKVLASLDSVFFSIDMEHGVIFNADSLPKGTDVSKLIPMITFGGQLSEATIRMIDNDNVATETDYLTNPTDTIDFSGKGVYLILSSKDKSVSKTIQLKVNVHQMDPDLLAWDDLQNAVLPSVGGAPRGATAVAFRNSLCALVTEHDGSYSFLSYAFPGGSWEPTPVGITGEVSDLTATDDYLYCLVNGDLHRSSDGLAWENMGQRWHSILGAYDNTVLGLTMEIEQGAPRYTCVQYPQQDYFTPQLLPADFPAEGASRMSTFSNAWSELPTGILAGGYTAGYDNMGCTWGFDGTQWAKLSIRQPEVAHAMLIPYYNYRKTSATTPKVQLRALLLVGGLRYDDGVPALNKTVYISYDYGISWQEASSNLQLPDGVPDLYDADAVLLNLDMSGSLAAGWTRMATPVLPPSLRVASYEIDGYDVSWQCPYIFLVGGYHLSGNFNRHIWRGVLNQLTFIPLI